MAIGDIGGVVTELIISCRTAATGTVNIARGDALKLTGAYTVTNATAAEDILFGEAMAASTQNDDHVSVKVRGISIFTYTGTTPPTVNGLTGVVASATAGCVKAPASGNGVGINLKVDTTAKRVHVLL